jgi:serine/threonine-protein kinase
LDALLQLRESLAERYDIQREIGAGGMATVYLAQDLRHDRPVALKLLNPELGAVLGVERFLSEIKVTANLQHPNLLPLFDSGAAEGLLYYVMPFVEGESLRRRLDREKQLPIDEAVRITVAIANALDYAHSHGVIHRDLKPENILLQAGQPVIADFGIALAVSNAGGSRITQTGLSLGTPQYMSPEQATGDRVIDGRSDIYSLGAVTYEMLTGEPPHTGNTAQAIIARMLTEKPRSMRSTRAAIPEHVELAVQHALEKLPADRFSSAHQFAEAMQGHTTAGTTGLYNFSAARRAPRETWKTRFKDPVTIGLAAVAIAALAFAALRKPAVATDNRVTRFVASTPDSLRPGPTFPWPGAISPDGSTLVYLASQSNSLFALRTDELEPRPIPNTEAASQVVFSPDGEWISFEANGKLRKVRIDGSTPIALADASSNNGADWSSLDDIILGSEGENHGLSKISASGGQLEALLKPDKPKGELDYLWPVTSNDGKTVAFAVWKGSLSTSMLAVSSTDGGEVTYLDLKGIRPLAFVGRNLVFLQEDGTVMAASLDRSLRKVNGRAVPVLDPVEVQAALNGNSEIFVSSGGGLLTSRGRTSSKLAWIEPNGSMNPLSNEVKPFGAPRLSPDGRTVALSVAEQGTNAIWLYDIDNKTYSKLTSVRVGSAPSWSSDGKTLYFSGVEAGNFGAYSQKADGGSDAEKLFGTQGPTPAVAVSPDNKSLLVTVYVENSWRLFRAEIGNAATPTPYINTKADVYSADFSPDGKWVALMTAESGRDEVVIRSYPNPSARIQISSTGGADPLWASDGSAVFYRVGNVIVRARLALTPALRVISRDTVVRNLNSVLTSSLSTQYDITRDGRFIGRASDRGNYQLIVVPNWKAELEAKLARVRRR